MSTIARKRIGQVIAVLSIVVGGGQLLVTGRALETLGLPVDGGTMLLFRLVSLMVVLFGIVIWQEIASADSGRRGVFWGGVQKISASALLLTALLADELQPLAWGIVAWDSLSGLFLVWISGEEKR